jgi:hypothetical protein
MKGELNSDKETIIIPVEVLMQLVANIVKWDSTNIGDKIVESTDNLKEVTLQKEELLDSLEISVIIDKESNVLKMPK